jgi:hypothetical protein
MAHRRMSAGAGLVFKGSGFYLTDYGKNAHANRGGEKTSAPESEKQGAPSKEPATKPASDAGAAPGASSDAAAGATGSVKKPPKSES